MLDGEKFSSTLIIKRFVAVVWWWLPLHKLRNPGPHQSGSGLWLLMMIWMRLNNYNSFCEGEKPSKKAAASVCLM